MLRQFGHYMQIADSRVCHVMSVPACLPCDGLCVRLCLSSYVCLFCVCFVSVTDGDGVCILYVLCQSGVTAECIVHLSHVFKSAH